MLYICILYVQLFKVSADQLLWLFYFFIVQNQSFDKVQNILVTIKLKFSSDVYETITIYKLLNTSNGIHFMKILIINLTPYYIL